MAYRGSRGGRTRHQGQQVPGKDDDLGDDRADNYFDDDCDDFSGEDSEDESSRSWSSDRIRHLWIISIFTAAGGRKGTGISSLLVCLDESPRTWCHHVATFSNNCVI